LFAGRRIPANDRLGGTVEQRLLAFKTRFEVGRPRVGITKFAAEIDGREYQERREKKAKRGDDRRTIESLTPESLTPESLTANSSIFGSLSGCRQERQSTCAQPEGWAEVR
jgi:hypothetical protein